MTVRGNYISVQVALEIIWGAQDILMSLPKTPNESRDSWQCSRSDIQDSTKAPITQKFMVNRTVKVESCETKTTLDTKTHTTDTTH